MLLEDIKSILRSGSAQTTSASFSYRKGFGSGLAQTMCAGLSPSCRGGPTPDKIRLNNVCFLQNIILVDLAGDSYSLEIAV